MKKIVFYTGLLGIFATSQAQTPFPMVYKSAWPVSVNARYSNADKTLALGGDMKGMSMIDATNGTVLWTIHYKEKFDVKKAEDWGWNKEASYVWVRIKEGKDVERTYYFDERTAAKIDDVASRTVKSDKKYGSYYNVWKAYTAYVGSFDDDANNIHVNLEYKRRLVGAAGGKGTLTDITVNSTGAYSWSTTFQGRMIRALCDNAVGSATSQDFGGDYINMVVGDNKVFVIYEGISVFDLNTGAKLWETSFDNSDFNFGILKSSQTLGKAAMPLVGNDGVYVADLSKGNHKIKKLDLTSGKVIWESPEFGKDDIIPELTLVNGALVARFGGKTEVQTYIPGQNGKPDQCKLEYKPIGPFGMKAFDAKTGATLWETSKMKELGDKFKGAISNTLVSGNNVVFASNKFVYAFDAHSGKVVFKTDISKSGIGLPEVVWERKGSVILESTTGIASVNLSDGKLNFGTKTKKNFGSFGTVDAYYVWVGKSAMDLRAFIRVDLDNGQILGIQKETGYPIFTPDYEAFLRYDGNKIARFKTKP
ncbi:MAG: PQQ-binding-like beta-propeller repeat protein [Bacteroidetes bacterium]|nr:PQQ-binding-like beta-propeller repeat protein [Bacteroidota bacterium]